MNRAAPEQQHPRRAGRIVMRGLRKRFLDIARQEEVIALDGIDLEIGDDEFLTVLGPSGCGKSSLLMLIAALPRPWGITTVPAITVKSTPLEAVPPIR